MRMDGTKSARSTKSISNLDCANRTVLDPSDLPVRVRPIQVMECWRMVGIEEPWGEGLQCERPVFKRFCVLAASHVVVKCLLDLSLRPPFYFATRCVDVLVSPFHELVLVVALGAEVTDESVSIVTCLLIDGDLLLGFRS